MTDKATDINISLALYCSSWFGK